MKHLKRTTWKTRGAKALCIMVLAGMMPVLTSCYGSFPITRTVHEFNGNITNSKWIHSIFLWVFLILPVYWLATVVDFFLLNIIEFWSGDTLLASTEYTLDDGREVAFGPGESEDVAILTIEREGELEIYRRMERQDNGRTLIYDEMHEHLATVTPQTGGGFLIESADGSQSELLSKMEIDQLKLAAAN